MWIPVLIIALVVIMAVGPLMWFRSSPAQRRVMALRKRAAGLGLRVQVLPLSRLALPGREGEANDYIAAYGLPWEGLEGAAQPELKRAAGEFWLLFTERISHESHFAGRWNWKPGGRADRRWWSPLRDTLSTLPADALALENNPRGLWLYWRERGNTDAVEQVAAALRELRHRRLTAAPKNGD